MTAPAPPAPPAPPALRALAASHAGAWLARPGEPPEPIGHAGAAALASRTPLLIVNAPILAARLRLEQLSGFDLLELWAFARPAAFVAPTAAALAEALGLDPPSDGPAEAAILPTIAARLLGEIGSPGWPRAAGAWDSAQALGRAGWPWAALVAARLTRPALPEPSLFEALPRWQEAPPRPAPRHARLAEAGVLARLAALAGPAAEDRPQQRAYALAVAHAFGPREEAGAPRLVLAEAGTGTGKTLGYLAPAAQWAEGSGGVVWAATFTRALQRQLDETAARLWPEAPGAVVVRKGRENYLCLLNLEDAVQAGPADRARQFAHLVARWARFTRDGDLSGGDLPGWLPALFGRGGGGIAALADRRGECVRAACPHWGACFIEHSQRAAERARLVIANHALVMANAVRERGEGRGLTRIIFDEGHHLFEAADSAFAQALTGAELLEARRWFLGPERATRGRRRGLAARLADVGFEDELAATALADLARAARALPAEGWRARLAEGAPQGPLEALLAAVRATVLARAPQRDDGFTLEAEPADLPPALRAAADAAAAALAALAGPAARLAARLDALVEAPPPWLDAPARARIEAARAGLERRQAELAGWQVLLARLGGAPDPDFVDWLVLERADGRELDCGIRRHWLDPTRPLAEAVLKPAHGVAITSATLRGGLAGAAGEAQAAAGWALAEARSGAVHLPGEPLRFAAPSPFDWASQARVLVVTDIDRRDPAALAGAYRALILAAGGGTLGLFTAIARLRAVHARIAGPLASLGLPLLAQHVDPVDTGTLVDMFRADARASLFGTDALRDGVDVPGGSLRLVVLEGVPWPRPTILHAARRAAMGGRDWDEAWTRARLAQAFGRLIRTRADRGVFVILGAATPSRLLTALPAAAPVARLSLLQACARVEAFLGPLTG
jgi:ATP-dependent DNA helicase DinG